MNRGTSVVVLALALLPGCSVEPTPVPDAGRTDSQADYAYAGCANEDQGCPRLPTLYCALEKILSDHSHCTRDEDCELVTNLEGRCSGFPRCRVSVNALERAAFVQAFDAEISRYCPADGGGCIASEGLCSTNLVFTAACISNVCRAVTDGGL